MLTAEDRQLISRELAKYRPPVWAMHPDMHCKQVTQFLRGILDRHFCNDALRPRAEFIPPCVWQWRDAKQALLRTRHREFFWSHLLDRAFAQWKTGIDYSIGVLLERHGLLYQLTAAAIKFVTGRIKQCIRKAKAEYISNLVYKQGDKAVDVLSQMKRAGLGRTRHRPPWRSMPTLLMPNGAEAGTRMDRDKVCLEHFGAQEYGTSSSTIHEPIAPLIIDEHLEWECCHLPSLGEIEHVLRQAPCRRATGLDAIPGEILRASPGSMSMILQPLMVKAAACLRQPMQWRGGLLYEAFKNSGSHRDPSAHRSLCVASIVGKTYHKVVRNKVQSQVSQNLREFHMGGRKHVPVVMPALYVLALQRSGCHRRCSTATLFLDTHAAYYRLVRDLATGCIFDDDAVVRLFRHFELDSEDLEEMMQVVRHGGMFADGGFPAAIRHATKDIHSNTWFTTPYTSGDVVCRSQAGSRPGESWSDVVYSFVYTRVLARIAELARGEHLLPELTYDRAPSLLRVKAMLRGKGACKAAAEYFNRGKVSMYLQDLQVHLPVTNQYKHLGGLLDSIHHGWPRLGGHWRWLPRPTTRASTRIALFL